MEKHRMDPHDLEFIEQSCIPYAVYQFVDRRVVTIALSAGFCELFGFDDRQEAYYVMDHDMYRDAHPDDRARIADIAVRFATEGGLYDAIYRTHTRGEYRIVHAHGKHVDTKTGVRLAVIWYTDEGPYTENEGAAFESRLNRAYNRGMRENSLFHENHFDHLTGLPSMTYFFELADARRTRLRAEGGCSVILFFDLCGMKMFNRTHGFAEGDKLIRAVSRVLIRHFGNENCSRFGQDHFAAVTELSDALEPTLTTIMEECHGVNGGKTLPIRVGIYTDRFTDLEISSACDRAKAACDVNRSAFLSAYHYFDDSMLAETANRRYILDNLDQAIEKHWIRVYYQPIIRAANGAACSEEALARWIDPENGLLPPSEFIHILEEFSLAYKLDLYVLEQVLKRLQNQAALGLYLDPVSVNLSRTDFDACDIVEEIRRRVDDSGIAREKICIEITESSIGNDFDFMKAQIERFRALGFRIWMDDFGSGYSSLDLLQSISFDLIKFDLHFMRNFDRYENSRLILSELVKMALSIGVETVVEGVETKEQAEFLCEIGCTKLQGFYYARPLSIAELAHHEENSVHLTFENPEEAAYFAEVGRVNLYNPSIDSGAASDAYSQYFDSIPMAVIEVLDDVVSLMRCNRSYREMLQTVFRMEIPEGGIHNTVFDQQPELDFFLAVRQAMAIDAWVQFDREQDDTTSIHSYIRPIAVNPVTGAVAVANIVLPMITRQVDEDAADDQDKAKLQNISANSVARALASDYACIYYIDAETNRFRIFSHSPEYMKQGIEPYGEDFFEASRQNAQKAVHPEDREQFIDALSKDKLLAALSERSVFTMTYRMLIDGVPRYFHLKATRMRDRRNGILIGVSDIDAQVREKEEYERARSSSLTYEHIAKALSKDYIHLYYVDLETEHFIEYSSHTSAEDLAVEQHSEHFFETARRDALKAVHPDDQQRVLDVFSKENILRALEHYGVFTLTYRLMTDGPPIYVNMKAARMDGDPRHLIIGVSSIDAQMQHQEALERVRAERITYARIAALSGDYIAIYTVDPVSGHYSEYSATSDYEGMGFAKEGDDFFAAAKSDGTRTLYLEDLDMYLTAFTKENVMDAIAEKGFFSLSYRLMMNGEPTYVNLKAAMIEEKDGPQLIVGVININGQVKRDQEYAHNLSIERNRANLDALTGVKNKHAYVDVEARLNHQIEEGLPLKFALVVCDVNNLKPVNDTKGHQAGDRYLQRARTILCRTFKNSPVFRVGGDEFAIIVQGQDYDNVETQLAELEACNDRNKAAGDIVIACGMARYEGDRSVAAVFERADKRMYQYKRRIKKA